MVFLIGWNKMFIDDDDSVEVNFVRIKFFCNELSYCFFIGVFNDEFEEKWKKLFFCLEGFELYVY